MADGVFLSRCRRDIHRLGHDRSHVHMYKNIQTNSAMGMQATITETGIHYLRLDTQEISAPPSRLRVIC